MTSRESEDMARASEFDGTDESHETEFTQVVGTGEHAQGLHALNPMTEAAAHGNAHSLNPDISIKSINEGVKPAPPIGPDANIGES